MNEKLKHETLARDYECSKEEFIIISSFRMMKSLMANTKDHIYILIIVF